MPRPPKHSILDVLTKPRLTKIARTLGIGLAQREAKATFIDAIADAATRSAILDTLTLEELKRICAVHKLDERGQKAVLKARLLSPTKTDEAPVAETPDPPVGSTAPPGDGKQGRSRKRKSKKKAGNGQNGLVALTKELWQAAVTLRGSIEPPDYKRYVLPLIFLRFLSLRYEKRRSELEASVASEESEYYGDTAVLEDPDEYRSAGAFVIPPEARWDSIRKAAQADDIKVKLDKVLELLEKKYPEKLRGLLPPIYAGSNMTAENLRGLINLFSKDVFTLDHGGEDLIGRVYEYFIGEFASSEGRRGGEYFTPVSIVRLLVAMLEPTKGIVFDPCCGSGGMFVQSDIFTKHSHQLAFYGQESKDFTYRLCRMNLFIHGIDGNIQLGNSYHDDRHATLKADYILANPPFNDGSRGEHGWGANKIADKDPRLTLANEVLPLSPRNANTMWILHFLSHLKDGGTAGFVMATGELSNAGIPRLAVRKALIEQDYVDCIVRLSGQLFANTQIPCALWFLSKNRTGRKGGRKRTGEILFIDAQRVGSMIPGSRRQRQLATDEIERIAATYRIFRTESVPDSVPGFCSVATTEQVRAHRFSLAPPRYVGSATNEDDEAEFEERFPRLVATLRAQLRDSEKLGRSIQARLAEVEQ